MYKFIQQVGNYNAIKYRLKLDVPVHYKITLFRDYLENGPYHVFGSHDKCAKVVFRKKCLSKHKNIK